jgi:hypothetical protein
MGFTPEQVKEITDIVAIAVSKATPAPQPAEQAPTEYADPVVEACEKAQIDAINAMPEGSVIVKGRTSSQHINRSQQKLDAIQNFLQNRRQYGSVTRIR